MFGVSDGAIAGRARSHSGFVWQPGLVTTADPLWERVLPAMAADWAAQDLGCSVAVIPPSRAEPAPTGDLCGSRDW